MAADGRSVSHDKSRENIGHPNSSTDSFKEDIQVSPDMCCCLCAEKARQKREPEKMARIAQTQLQGVRGFSSQQTLYDWHKPNMDHVS